ncbi:hypothetical protein PR202_gb26165 [Eleusine coracana subsp. coracana]|uniref:Protein kinase domain-containing protein n=1 Tax=Eleusine coracana subsp. coracana TaxID=191504 RepID=A0AAV5FQU6_ELECO|nr:hypothetical protein PR202_gb26137 [Eleusine coracana subsp. coracana]GJN37234.1 hypothetical protein PR202_gb26165 [Eleusine coracana subsp. coracana]
MAAPTNNTEGMPRVGTLRYRAPEQLAGDGRRYGPGVDAHADEVSNLRNELSEGGLRAFDELPAFRGVTQLSRPAREVLAGLLAFRPDDRLTAAAALRHRWFALEAQEERPCRRVARAPRSASASVLMVTVGDG